MVTFGLWLIVATTTLNLVNDVCAVLSTNHLEDRAGAVVTIPAYTIGLWAVWEVMP